MNQNINQLAHELVQTHIQPHHVCLDATCGNGHDTVFLANLAKSVDAIDIQAKAIQTTKARLSTLGLDNVTFHHASHDQLVLLFDPSKRFDIVMYNLGYLPSSDHSIITTPTSTVSSLRQVLSFLHPGGLIAMTLYIGHEGGQEEANAVERFLTQLDKHDYTIQKTTYLNRKESPYLIAIQKIK